MKCLLLLLAIVPSICFATARNQAIYLTIKDPKGPVILRKNISNAKDLKKELGLGENLDGAILTLQGPASGELAVEYQYESTLGLSDEGPHLDLYDWKHSESEWKALEKSKTGVFLFPKKVRYSEFPPVTTEEIVEAVKKHEHGREKWIELAKLCTSVNTVPCHVGISQIRIRVLKGTDTIHKLVLVTPMGC